MVTERVEEALAAIVGAENVLVSRAERVVYMGKLARRDNAPSGVGVWMMNVWVPGWAWEHGYDVVRLDAEAAWTSATSVDVDEEMMNMLTTQRAYEGAARMLTAVDQALDTLINRTGLVGR